MKNTKIDLSALAGLKSIAPVAKTQAGANIETVGVWTIERWTSKTPNSKGVIEKGVSIHPNTHNFGRFGKQNPNTMLELMVKIAENPADALTATTNVFIWEGTRATIQAILDDPATARKALERATAIYNEHTGRAEMVAIAADMAKRKR